MIRKTWPPSDWLVTTQTEHARLAGLIATSWNFSKVRPCEEVLWAIAHHDDGWKSVDEQGLTNKRLEPATFTEVSGQQMLQTWNQGIDAALESNRPYSARLIAAYFVDMAKVLDLHKFGAREAMEIGKFIYTRERQLSDLANQPGGNGPTDGTSGSAAKVTVDFARDLRFLQVCDAISLSLASDFTGEMTIDDVPFLEAGSLTLVRKRADSLSMTMAPLPFKKNLRDHFHSWILPQREYNGSEDLKDVLASTKQTINEIHIGVGQ